MGPSDGGGHERHGARKRERAVICAVAGDQPLQLVDHGGTFRVAERGVEAAHVTVLGGHPGPEAGRVADGERLPQRLRPHVCEPGGSMDLRCLFGAAEAAEGARVVGALRADDRRSGGPRVREPRVLGDRRPSAVTMRPPTAVTRRSSRSVTTGSVAIISARRLAAAANRPSANGSAWSKSAWISVTRAPIGCAESRPRPSARRSTLVSMPTTSAAPASANANVSRALPQPASSTDPAAETAATICGTPNGATPRRYWLRHGGGIRSVARPAAGRPESAPNAN